MSYFKSLTHDFRPPLQGGEPLCDGKTWPVTLATVPLDRSGTNCGVKGGWHFCRDIETTFNVAGMWRTGRPNAIVVVEPHGDIIEREDKCRAASLTLTRTATAEELRAAILRFSTPFAPHVEAVAQEQWLWYEALGRPLNDRAAVVAGLHAALAARSLAWTLREFPSIRDARAAWAAWDAWDAWAAWDAWDARDAWEARDAWAAWDDWAARAALTMEFSVLKKWTKGSPDFLTRGILSSYENGLGITIPTGESELGWAMEEKR